MMEIHIGHDLPVNQLLSFLGEDKVQMIPIGDRHTPQDNVHNCLGQMVQIHIAHHVIRFAVVHIEQSARYHIPQVVIRRSVVVVPFHIRLGSVAILGKVICLVQLGEVLH